MSDVQLRVENLHKTYDPGLFEEKKRVLRGVDFEVGHGEIFGFLGPNGSGKTTTIKAITGIIFPDKGSITIGGMPHDSQEAKRTIGYMPENPVFYNHLSGIELLRFYADLLGMERKNVGSIITDLINTVGLQRSADAKLRTYSKGMLQRLALAQSLLNNPELLILDEPLSGLDPIGRRDVRDTILQLRDQGTTIFFSSHIIPDVERICDRVAILLDGRIQTIGNVRDIVAMEVENYELTFTGIDADSLSTTVIESNRGADSAWVLVTAERRDALIKEITDRGGSLVSLVPVRSSLEDVLIGAIEEVGK